MIPRRGSKKIQALYGTCAPGARLSGYALDILAVINDLAGRVDGFDGRDQLAHGLIPAVFDHPHGHAPRLLRVLKPRRAFVTTTCSNGHSAATNKAAGAVAVDVIVFASGIPTQPAKISNRQPTRSHPRSLRAQSVPASGTLGAGFV